MTGKTRKKTDRDSGREVQPTSRHCFLSSDVSGLKCCRYIVQSDISHDIYRSL